MEMDTIEDLLARLKERPSDSELFQQLGQAYTKAGRTEEAREAFERSLELDPDNAFSHLYLGNWFYGKRLYPDALARFRRAAELLPDEAVAHWCIGDVYHAEGRFDLAQSAYQTA